MTFFLAGVSHAKLLILIQDSISLFLSHDNQAHYYNEAHDSQPIVIGDAHIVDALGVNRFPLEQRLQLPDNFDKHNKIS